MQSHIDAIILVVDDNIAGRYATAHVLRSAGWNVVESATGRDALEKVNNQEFDLIILDVNLPDIDGFEVCRIIRSNEKHTRLSVIHLSATFVSDVYKIQGLETGADGYLIHPVEPPVLIATVRAFLRARAAEADREKLLISERAAREEAEKANQIKDDFLATLSHELRTPLHVIVGWIQLLKSGMLSAEDTAEAINVIDRNAQAQAQMIADLLDISRITTGKLRLDVQPLNPATIVEAAVLGIIPTATAKDIRITRNIDIEPTTITADPSRLQQVVWNLVNNALKFTPPQGHITVSLQKVNSYIEITVADSGIGIDTNLLPKIFDRFHQGDSSTTRCYGGLGLGLAIARQLVELHGGQIKAESTGLDQGSKFTVLLPVTLTPQQNDQIPAMSSSLTITESGKPHEIRLKGVRILLVDDDPDARKMLIHMLTNCGADIRDASCMKDGLKIIEEFKPQILLSDVGMPEHDGYEFISRVRTAGYTAKMMPAIALTAFARPEDRYRALLTGFQSHLSKPVDSRELTAAIATLID
jgi:signal transduction histidine kinase